MSKKILVVGATIAPTIAEALNKQEGSWDMIEMVVVRDEDYEEAIAMLRNDVPRGKVLRDVVGNFVDIKNEHGVVTRVHLLADSIVGDG